MPFQKSSTPQDIGGIYLDNRGWLLRWLRGKTQCSERASDLLHDTFVRLLSKGPDNQAYNPQALLMAIAKRVLIDHWRRQNIEQAYLEALSHLPEPEVPTPEQQYLLLETLTEIDHLLAGLPVLVRQAFLLAQLDGLKQAEIAAKLNLSISTVKRYLVQAATQCYFANSANNESYHG